MRRETKRTGVFTRRALFVAGAQVTALGVLGAKLYQVQVVDGERYATLAETNRISARLIAPPRGRLLDRSGTVIAGNRLNWRALLIAEQAADIDLTLDNLSEIVPLPDHERARIEREVRRHRRFVPIVVQEFLSWEDMARIEVNAPDLPGVLVDLGTTRTYPFGPSLAHIVGYVAPPNDADVAANGILALPGMRVGRAGVEKFHEPRLRGRAGAVQLEVNAVGRVIRELERQEGTPGQEITLTIDYELQKSVMARLGDQSASAVVLDARNGEVLTMTTTPSFDPSLFNSGVSQAQWIQWTNDRKAPLIDKASAGLYAPGSTFKMVVALSALQAKSLTPYDRINCPGYLDFGDRRFHCWSKYGHGSLDLQGGLKNSCDVFFFETARRTGIDNIAAMANRFGLGVDLDIELPGASKGLVPTREWRMAHGHAWNIGDTIVHGIGQGFLQLTPLQLATMVARIASGRALQPHLTRAINGVLQPGNRPEDWPSMGLPDKFMHAVRQGMWAVVNEPGGTAPLARLGIPGVQLAGKTGSVQVRNVSRAAREHGYSSDNLPWELRPHALFVAYAPFDNPKYAVSLVVEHGNAGAQAAAPVARDIMADVLTRDPSSDRQAPAQRVADGRST
jgi:penicillin-binding protein 2